MRIPLNPAGSREMAIMTVIFGCPAVIGVIGIILGCPWCWLMVGIFGLAWLAGMAFFRDPERSVPDDSNALVSPADGKVVETIDLDHHDEIGGPAKRISIFLSVLDVHVNRSPCTGLVKSIRYQPGKYLDARNPDSGKLNEANTIIIEPDEPHAGPVVVRQIAGLIARRIVCNVSEGDRVKTGQRIGLIKFGSRTELIVPRHDTYTPEVKVGDRVYGAKTILARRVK